MTKAELQALLDFKRTDVSAVDRILLTVLQELVKRLPDDKPTAPCPETVPIGQEEHPLRVISKEQTHIVLKRSDFSPNPPEWLLTSQKDPVRYSCGCVKYDNGHMLYCPHHVNEVLARRPFNLDNPSGCTICNDPNCQTPNEKH